MKKTLSVSLYIIVSVFVISCTSVKPTDFSFYYNQNDTGLASRINTEGYYVSTRECDSTFFSVYMFYPDGLFTIATTSNVSLVSDCFTRGGDSKVCQYPSWGTYRLSGDTIKTQTIIIEGMATSCIFRDYLILADSSIVNISDYVNPAKTKLMYMANYPSFTQNRCGIPARFFPSKKKRNKSDCPYIHKKWFYGK